MLNFEDCETMSDTDKQRYIIVNCLQRLYRYVFDPDMNIYENRVLCIEDDIVLSDSYLISKTKI